MQLTSLFAALLLALLQVLPGPPARRQAADTLAPYIGTWVSRTPEGEFKLVLEERKQFHVGNDNMGDLITGQYAYVTPNGPVNESLSLPANEFVLSCSADENSPGGLYGSFIDVVKHKSFSIKLSFADAAKTQLLWVITGQRESWTLRSDKPVLPGVSVPTRAVLARVN